MKIGSSITYFREIHYSCKKRSSVSHRSFYVTPDERKQLIVDAKEAGLVLFEHLLYLVAIKKQDEISDQDIAEYFGWQKSKASRIRKKLMKAAWFRAESFVYSGGRKGTTYYVGKDAVSDSHSGNTAPFQSQTTP